MTTFAQLGLPDALVDALSRLDFVEPFPVQSATIPDALAGRDVSGKAPTGSGKTLAFGLPLLARVGEGAPKRPRALVLAPTRELAEQISQELEPLARAVSRRVLAVYGGVAYGRQKGPLSRGVDVLVATPGRLEDLIEQRSVDLSRVDIAVIDEADRMADMGFLPAVRRILDQVSDHRQTVLFSATLDKEIAVLSRDYQRDPVGHEVESDESEAGDIHHHFWLVQHQDRAERAAEVVERMGRSIVFTRTRHRADRLAKQLARFGIEAVALHGGRSQSQRTRALKAFSSGRAQALVATDVAARGIDIDAVASVVHFDLPADSKDYLHRSGRTARAGAGGTVVSFVTDDQRGSARGIQKALDIRAPIEAPQLETLQGTGAQTRGPAPERAPRKKESNEPSGRHTRDSGGSGQSIYVANLPWATTTDEVKDLFGRFGRVHETTIITDRRTGRSKGFGFVDMAEGSARTAIEELHGSSLGGRSLTVRPARPRRDAS